jgi:hypothetical protein
MSYKNIEELDDKEFYTDLYARKEFKSLYVPPDELETDDVHGFVNASTSNIEARGLHLHTVQQFVRNFMRPENVYTKTCLLKWSTGAGKTIGFLSICNEFLKYQTQNTENPKEAFMLSFGRSIIKNDLMYPEFGFVTAEESSNLEVLKARASMSGAKSMDQKILMSRIKQFQRRITDPTTGGHYAFYGYREFANHLFILTQKGKRSARVDLKRIYVSSDERDIASFIKFIDNEVKDGNIVINTALLDRLKDALICADEIQEVYNINSTNNYGVAIQYVMEVLKEHAPKLIIVSATPIKGSSTEVIEILNLLNPGLHLRKEDLFNINVPVSWKPQTVKIEEPEELIEEPTESLEETTETPVETITETIPEETTEEIVDETTVEEDGKGLPEVSDDIDESPDVEDVIDIKVELKEDAWKRIREYNRGKISFLIDTNTLFYASRTFMGSEVEGLPYLKFVFCGYSPLHKKMIESIRASDGRVHLMHNMLPLYSMVFPNPESEEIGIYKSEDISQLRSAPQEWLDQKGIEILQPILELTLSEVHGCDMIIL